MINTPLNRLDIVVVDFGPLVKSSSIQRLVRPALVLQPSSMNNSSTTTIVCPLSSVKKKLYLPYHIVIKKRFGLHKDSVALLEQTTVIDQLMIKKHIGHIDDASVVAKIDKGLLATLGISESIISTSALTQRGY